MNYPGPPEINPDYPPSPPNPWMTPEDDISAAPKPISAASRMDFMEAMAKNRRNTWWLLLGMIALSAGFGYILGWAWDVAVTGTITAGIDYSMQMEVDWMALLAQLSPSGVKVALALSAAMAVLAVYALWRADKFVLSKTEATDADPLRYAQLHNIVEEMAIAAGIPKPRVVIVATDVPNAFATGLRTENAVVGVTQGLLTRLNRREMQGVIAHEVGHVVNGDMRYATIVAVMTGALVFIAQLVLDLRRVLYYGGRSTRYDGRRGSGALSVILLVAVFILAAIIVPLVAKMLQMAISRQREYLADATAVQLTRDPGGLIGALEKISQDQDITDKLPQSLEPLYIMTPKKMLQNSNISWLSTHPPLEKRIERLKALE